MKVTPVQDRYKGRRRPARLSDGLRAALQSGEPIATGRDATVAEREAADDLRTALAAIWARHPTLTSNGFMDPDEPGYGEARAKILTYPQDFRLARSFLLSRMPGWPRAKSPYYSYSLKHAAERWARIAELGQQPYVSNGAMIAAAISLDWAVRPEGLNAWLSRPTWRGRLLRAPL